MFEGMFRSVVGSLREARWLNADRALAWGRILAVLSFVTLISLAVVTAGGRHPDPWGRPLGPDFSSFWSAAKLAANGQPGAPWTPAEHRVEQTALFPPHAGYADDYYAFFYPPPFLLICLPLGLLSYGMALALWLATTCIAYLAVVRGLLPRQWPSVLVGIAFPAFLLNAEHGQNAALSTALIGAASLWLDRRPVLAGVCLGVMCFKPHLALLTGPTLLFARRWRSLAAAVITASLFCLASLFSLGSAAWRGFLSDAALARATLEQGLVGYGKMVSSFAGMRLLNASVTVAWSVQVVVALAALAVVADVARRCASARADAGAGGRAGAEMAALAAAACLATPFVFDYDLMLLAVPLAWVSKQAGRYGWLPWEKLVLAAGFLLTLVTRLLAMSLDVPVAPLVVSAVLVVIVRRIGWAPS